MSISDQGVALKERKTRGWRDIDTERVGETGSAPAERVFAALTQPDLYSRWMGPECSHTDVREMDPVPGGRFALTVTLPNGFSVDIEGEYLTVEPPTRLSHTWVVEGDDTETTVSIELRPAGDGTQLVLVHDGFTEATDRDQNDGGWRHQLARLATLLG